MSNFKKVGSSDTVLSYVRYTSPRDGADLPDNVSVAMKDQVLAEGTYLGSTPGRFGLVHQVRTEENQVTVLGGTGGLNSGLSKVDSGSKVRITYGGKEAMTKGKFAGTLAHQFLIERDEDAALDESASPIIFTASAGAASDSAGDAWEE